MLTRRAVLALALLLVLATIAVFSPARNHDFLLLDDDAYVTENPTVRDGLTARGLSWSLTALRAQNWHPLTWVSHMLDAQLFGLDPRGHHLTSVALHAAAAALLFIFLQRATGALWTSAAVAALFALHPLRAESVAWVAERKDVLSALLWMLTLLAYHRWTVRRGTPAYLATLAIFVLGLAAKPMLVTLPLVLLLLDYWPLGRFSPGRGGGRGRHVRLLIEKAPFLALALLTSGAAYLAQSRGAVLAMVRFPLGDRIANAIVATAIYLGKAAVPTGLSFYYPLKKAGWPAEVVLAAAALLALISVAAFLLRRRSPWFVAGWLWYLATLLPVIGLVQIGLQARADRYTYLPLVGVFLAAGWEVREQVSRWRVPAAAVGAAAAAALITLSLLTWRQVGYWKDTETLTARALEQDDDNWFAHKLMSDALARRGRAEEAQRHYLKSLQTLPGWTHRGAEVGRFAERRSSEEAVNRLAAEADRLTARGRVPEAIASFREAVRLNPARVDLAARLGEVLVGQGRVPEAVECFQQALRVEPRNADLHYNLGVTLVMLRRFEEAAAAFRSAIEIDPASADARQNLGVALRGLGRTGEAIGEFREALRLDPGHAKAAENLNATLAARGR